MIESFQANPSLTMCKLIRLPSTYHSLITIAPALSNINSREVLITKMPEPPFCLADVKSGYEIIKKIKCCFNIKNVRVIKKKSKNISIVEISKSSGSVDRVFVINHFAAEASEYFEYTMIPDKCECRRTLCQRCKFTDCNSCSDRLCLFCQEECDKCNEWVCGECNEFCRDCERRLCSNCFDDDRSGYSKICSECDF